MRRGTRGNYYLDVLFEGWNVVVEVDGIHHTWAENVVADAARHNEIALRGAVILRIPLLGLRVDPDTFFDEIARALQDAGWVPEGSRPLRNVIEVVARATSSYDVRARGRAHQPRVPGRSLEGPATRGVIQPP